MCSFTILKGWPPCQQEGRNLQSAGDGAQRSWGRSVECGEGRHLPMPGMCTQEGMPRRKPCLGPSAVVAVRRVMRRRCLAA